MQHSDTIPSSDFNNDRNSAPVSIYTVDETKFVKNRVKINDIQGNKYQHPNDIIPKLDQQLINEVFWNEVRQQFYNKPEKITLNDWEVISSRVRTKVLQCFKIDESSLPEYVDGNVALKDGVSKTLTASLPGAIAMAGGNLALNSNRLFVWEQVALALGVFSVWAIPSFISAYSLPKQKAKRLAAHVNAQTDPNILQALKMLKRINDQYYELPAEHHSSPNDHGKIHLVKLDVYREIFDKIINHQELIIVDPHCSNPNPQTAEVKFRLDLSHYGLTSAKVAASSIEAASEYESNKDPGTVNPLSAINL